MNNGKKYDLEERTTLFAISVRQTLKSIKKTIINIDDIKQVIRSSGSVGANYMEANDGVSKKDTAHRLKICRKEAKETKYWFSVIDVESDEQEKIDKLKNEAEELMKIFGAIIRNLK